MRRRVRQIKSTYQEPNSVHHNSSDRRKVKRQLKGHVSPSNLAVTLRDTALNASVGMSTFWISRPYAYAFNVHTPKMYLCASPFPMQMISPEVVQIPSFFTSTKKIDLVPQYIVFCS